MDKLTLKLLGPPEVHLSGRPVRFRAKKALALLAYLAAEGKPRTRGEIATLLWPRSDEVRSRSALRTALLSLRGSLREAAEPLSSPPEPEHLLTDGDFLDLGPEVEIDLRTLEAAFSLARSLPRAQGPVEPGDARFDERRDALAKLRDAVEVYRGNFLEGFSLNDAPDFDLWVELQRESWRGCADLVYDRLSELRLESGEVKDAIATAAVWARHDPLNEDACRRLMEAQMALGDHSGALNTYEAFRSALETLGTEPDPYTEALAARVRAVPRRAAARRASQAKPSARAPLDVPLVGRSSEFSTLVGEYYAASGGEARVVAVLGEAGIGKTRLAEEFIGWAETRGADVLRGGAFEAGGGLPYGPVVEALRPRVGRERAPDDLLEDVWLSELSRLLPELRERYPDLPAPTSDEATAKTRLFEAASKLVEALAERAPVVLLVDDLHWADVATLDVLHYAVRRCAEEASPVLLVAALREEALEAPALSEWLTTLSRNLPVRRLTLDPLTSDDTVNLLRASAAGADGRRGYADTSRLEQLGRWLFAETGGQPFFLTETLETLLERGVIATRPGSEGGWEIRLAPDAQGELGLDNLLPGRVREVLHGKLSHLGPEAFELVAAAAVLGSGFAFEHACRVADLRERESLSALDEALQARLVGEAGGEVDHLQTSGSYAFTHDKIREVAYTEAGTARRRVLHRRALAVLGNEGTPPAELARHALAAGVTEAAFDHLLEAGDEAMAVFAAEDAIGYYEQARDLLTEKRVGRDSWDSRSTVQLEHLYVNLGRAHELAGEWEEAQGTYEEMLSHAREAREPRLECAALNHLAILAAQQRFDMGRAAALVREALKAAEASGDRAMLAETEWNLAQMTTLGQELGVALSHGEKALDLARETSLEELEARSLWVLGLAHTFAGRWEECVDHASRAAALYEALGDEPTDAGALATQFIWGGAPPSKGLANQAMEVVSLSMLATGEVNRGSPRAGVEAGRRALRIGQEIDNDWVQTNAMVPLNHGLLEAGEYGEALRLAQSGVQMARRVRYPMSVFMLTILGNTLQTMLGLEEAHAAYLEALAAADSLPVRRWKMPMLCGLCTNQALAGDWEAAHRYALEAMALREAALARLAGYDFCRHHETEALLRGGEERLAREDARRLGESIGQNRRFRLVHLRMLAVLDRWDGHAEGALGHLQEAETLAEEMELPGELWQIRATLGELYQESGDEERAGYAFSRAAETVEALADKIEDEALREGFLDAPQVRRVLGR